MHIPEKTEQPPRGERRNLILLRAGDASLHGSFFKRSETTRTWDLHVSYYGAAGAPATVDGETFSWSNDQGSSKFNGIAACIKKAPHLLELYDYIAIPDDDLLFTKGDWDAAFQLARQYDLVACQPSLNPLSFYSHDITLRRRRLRLRWVSLIEAMAPIIRADVFKQLMPILALPDNVWAVDHVLAEIVSRPKAFAVLDEVSVLHTRAVASGPSYDAIRAARRTPQDVFQEFMQRHGFTRHEFRLLGAVDRSGKVVGNLRSIERTRIWPSLLQEYRRASRFTRITRPGLVSHLITDVGVRNLPDLLVSLARLRLRAHRRHMRKSHPRLYRVERAVYIWSGLRSAVGLLR
jgi:hypothetical protein